MIDTDAKRCNALATRRLPWFRRFAPWPPDGTVSTRDRLQGGFVYEVSAAPPGGTAVQVIGGGLLRGGVASTG